MFTPEKIPSNNESFSRNPKNPSKIKNIVQLGILGGALALSSGIFSPDKAEACGDKSSGTMVEVAKQNPEFAKQISDYRGSIQQMIKQNNLSPLVHPDVNFGMERCGEKSQSLRIVLSTKENSKKPLDAILERDETPTVSIKGSNCSFPEGFITNLNNPGLKQTTSTQDSSKIFDTMVASCENITGSKDGVKGEFPRKMIGWDSKK
jgi:hypothetical protein